MPPPRSPAGACGFTLLEMLVALAVFAVIGVMSGQLVQQIAGISERIGSRGEQLVALQRAANLMRRDLQQLAYRPVRDQLGDAGQAVQINQGDLLEFTRRGWSNPLGAPRSELQRVGYQLDKGALYRLFWPVLDRASDGEPVRQLMLAEVESIEVAAVDAKGEEHGYWPLADAGGRALAAVAVRFVLPHFGEIERFWTVPLAPLPDAGADDSLLEDVGEEREDGPERPEDDPATADRLA